MQFANVKRSKYDDYTYPLWADVAGWLFVGFEVALIPGVAIYKVVTMKTNIPLLQVSVTKAKDLVGAFRVPYVLIRQATGITLIFT